MKKFNDWSIQRKLVAVVAAGAVVGLSIGATSMALALAEGARNAREVDALAVLQSVRPSLAGLFDADSIPEEGIERTTGNAAVQRPSVLALPVTVSPTVSIRVCSSDGRLVARTPMPMPTPMDDCTSDKPSFSGILDDISVSDTITATDGSPLGTIVVRADLSGSRREWSGAVARGAAGLLAALVLVCFAASLIGSRVALSVRSLTTLIDHAVQRSDFSARAEVTSRDELGKLAGTLNTLLIEVESRYGHLVQTKGELESTVREQAASVDEANALLVESRNQAEEIQRVKNAFLANVSHEFRTPLNGIVGMAHLLGETGLNARQSEYVDGLLRSVDSLRAVIDDMLDFSRLESGRTELERESLSIGDEIRTAVAPLMPRIQEKGLSFGIVIGDGVPARVLGDGTRIRRVVLGLVSNAVKFTSDGRITVEVESDRVTPADLILHIAVRDSGNGIPKDKQQAIFETFTQADASTTRMYGGTGLGLAICLRLVSLMGGRMWLESRPGKGTTFHLTLPVGIDDVSRRRTAISEAAPGSGLRILVAEDNMVSRKLLTRLLEGKGHDVTVATDGVSTLEAIGDQDFDLLLLDLQMPHMGGLEAARRIREDEANQSRPRLPIIALTAQSSQDDRRQCLEVGFDAFLTKPVNTRELFEAVDAAVPRQPVFDDRHDEAS